VVLWRLRYKLSLRDPDRDVPRPRHRVQL
jgi:hypothetical protein